MKKTKNILLLLVLSVILTMPVLQQKSYSQTEIDKYRKEAIINKKNFNSDKKNTVIKRDRLSRQTGIKRHVSREEIQKIINKNTKSFRKNTDGTWLINEDFESGNFPPPDWYVEFGNTEWELGYTSGYGNGYYSMLYSNWQCNYSNNFVYTPLISPTNSGDKLIFDFAYAPYDDGKFISDDDLEIFYFDDNDQEWYSLAYYNGYELQTAPGTDQYFEPQSNEWSTMIVNIPPGATVFCFQVYEDCGNNLFLDNIKVGNLSSDNDASVEKVWAKGKLPLVYGVPDKISALIKNNSVNPITNLAVNLDISGTSTLSDTYVIPYLGPGDTMQVDFNGYTPVLNGPSTVSISVPPDEDNNNNERSFESVSNPNTFRYVDEYCCNASVGWIGENAFLNKYRLSGSGQIKDVNIKLSAGSNTGQVVYAIVVDENGYLVGKSQYYKIQEGDEGVYKSFKITDPKPYATSNSVFYVGIAQTQYSGNDFAFTPQQFYYDATARPDANYFIGGLAPVGTNVGVYEFPREYGQNYAIEAVIENSSSVDAGVADLGLTLEQYFAASTYTPTGKVFNAGTGSATFTVNRKITPGGYSSTKTITGLAAGTSTTVTYDPWTFTSGTTYTIRDSVIFTGDLNLSNNVMSNSIIPRIAKQICVLWQQQDDRDSLVRAINSDGRYANNFDTVRMNYTGSYRPWKIVFANFKNEANYAGWTRDSLKAYLDNSTSGNKKSLIVFGNTIAYYNDPVLSYPNPADTIFYRQYLKSKSISDNWPADISDSQSRFRGIGFFNGISQDSVSDPATPELIMPVNGGISAFKPQSVTGNGADSCNAVCYAGTNYNTFFMTNKFSSLRATNSSSSPLGPVRVYTKIIDWLQSISTGSKVLDLTVLLEGMYDVNSNTMVSDTIRVYLRNSTFPYSVVDSAKANLNQSGHASLLFNNALNGVNYYIQIIHRNSIETWSKLPQMFVSNNLTYDFTTASSKAYENNMKLMGSRWAIYTGDAVDFGIVDVSDISLIENASANSDEGYIQADLNNDLYVDATDVSLVENNASLGIYAMSPLLSYAVLPGENDKNTNNYYSGNILNQENKTDNEIYEKTKNLIQGTGKNGKRDLYFYRIQNGRAERKALK